MSILHVKRLAGHRRYESKDHYEDHIRSPSRLMTYSFHLLACLQYKVQRLHSTMSQLSLCTS